MPITVIQRISGSMKPRPNSSPWPNPPQPERPRIVSISPAMPNGISQTRSNGGKANATASPLTNDGRRSARRR